MHGSEPRSKAEAELFHLVVVFLDDRERQIDANRSERRPPGNANASRHTDGMIIDQPLRRNCIGISDSVHIVQSTDVGECVAGNPEFIRQTDRESQFGAGAGKLIAAKRVVTYKFTRTNASRCEAAQAITAKEETVGNRHVLIDADDIADFTEEAQHGTFGDREVNASTQPVTRELSIATKARDLVVQADEVAFRRVDAAIACIVHQFLANQRDETGTFLLPNETRGIGSDVIDLSLLQRIVEALPQLFG